VEVDPSHLNSETIRTLKVEETLLTPRLNISWLSGGRPSHLNSKRIRTLEVEKTLLTFKLNTFY